MINYLDRLFIHFARSSDMLFARLALFLIFFWFGLLKVLGESPANPLVGDLLNRTMPWIDFSQFIVIFGVIEMIIGLSFLLPQLVRLSIALLALHMVTTFMPLVLLPQDTWASFLVPTLEGQYIIKNLVIVALALSIVANIKIPNVSELQEND